MMPTGIGQNKAPEKIWRKHEPIAMVLVLVAA
jgi:hypothetical protein